MEDTLNSTSDLAVVDRIIVVDHVVNRVVAPGSGRCRPRYRCRLGRRCPSPRRRPGTGVHVLLQFVGVLLPVGGFLLPTDGVESALLMEAALLCGMRDN